MTVTTVTTVACSVAAVGIVIVRTWVGTTAMNKTVPTAIAVKMICIGQRGCRSG